MPLSSIGKIWAYTSEKITEIFGLMVQRLDDVIAGGGLGVGGGEGKTLIRRGRESLPPWVGVKINDFGLTLGVYDETPIFLAL